jgi:hypothetical protein
LDPKWSRKINLYSPAEEIISAGRIGGAKAWRPKDFRAEIQAAISLEN